MKRRSLFELTGALLLFLSAGCMENSKDNNVEGLQFFRNELEKNNISILNLEIVSNNTKLKYKTNRTTNQGLGDEIGAISASYVLSRQNGLDTNRLISVINDGNKDMATWHIRTEWIKEFEADEISPDEFTGKILNTVELTN